VREASFAVRGDLPALAAETCEKTDVGCADATGVATDGFGTDCCAGTGLVGTVGIVVIFPLSSSTSSKFMGAPI
jgi:hypothetical protein